MLSVIPNDNKITNLRASVTQ